MTDEIPARRSNPAPPRPPHLFVMDAVRLYNTQAVAIEDHYTIAIGEADAVRMAARTYVEATNDTAGADAMLAYAAAAVEAADDLRARRRGQLASGLRVSLGGNWPLRVEAAS